MRRLLFGFYPSVEYTIITGGGGRDISGGTGRYPTSDGYRKLGEAGGGPFHGVGGGGPCATILTV